MRHNDDCPKRPNGLRISRAATIERYKLRADSGFQKRPDLAAAQRRRTACAGWVAPLLNRRRFNHNMKRCCWYIGKT